MSRIHVVAEGQSEQAFVHRVLAPHLGLLGIGIDARCVVTSRRHGKRGGMTSYARARTDITTWLKEDRDPALAFTTMFDLYHLPTDFPGHAQATQQLDPRRRATSLEAALVADIRRFTDGDPRFRPYLQVHEFEALLLSDLGGLKTMYPAVDLQRLVEVVGETEPELIDLDDPPSKRIARVIPQYDKVAAAVQVAEAVGLAAMRARCPSFAAWVTWLESRAPRPPVV